MTVKTEMGYWELQNALWSGGEETAMDLTYEQFTQIADMFEEVYADSEGIVDITDFNDFLWFERDTVAEWLGFENYEALLGLDEYEEEDEEEDN